VLYTTSLSWCVSLWAVLLHRLCGRKGGSTRPQDIGELLRLRQHMGHLITNLQVYLQLDVIEANFDWLEHQVAAAQVGPAHPNKAVHRHGALGRSLAFAAADASLGKLCCLQANKTQHACQWYGWFCTSCSTPVCSNRQQVGSTMQGLP